jgi:hypothetical protein
MEIEVDSSHTRKNKIGSLCDDGPLWRAFGLKEMPANSLLIRP